MTGTAPGLTPWGPAICDPRPAELCRPCPMAGETPHPRSLISRSQERAQPEQLTCPARPGALQGPGAWSTPEARLWPRRCAGCTSSRVPRHCLQVTLGTCVLPCRHPPSASVWLRWTAAPRRVDRAPLRRPCWDPLPMPRGPWPPPWPTRPAQVVSDLPQGTRLSVSAISLAWRRLVRAARATHPDARPPRPCPGTRPLGLWPRPVFSPSGPLATHRALGFREGGPW